MRYLGGKVRLAKEIAAKIVEYIPFGGTYVEPFCGGCAMDMPGIMRGGVCLSMKNTIAAPRLRSVEIVY